MSENETIKLTLKVWRQSGPQEPGRLETIAADDVDPNMSFLEMLDALNEKLILEDKDPMVNGIPHGQGKGMTICQLHMRAFSDGDTIVVEPFRGRAFKVIKDLIVDRGALDKIIQTGGYISVNTGGTPDANAIPIAQEIVEKAMDAAACIGCGACVATCPNASAMLFVSAKVSQFALLPQGRPEATQRVLAMLKEMDSRGFGNCTNHRVCETACPKEISITHIARFNREFLKAALLARSNP